MFAFIPRIFLAYEGSSDPAGLRSERSASITQPDKRAFFNPPEYKSPPADPLSLYGLIGVGLTFLRSGSRASLSKSGFSGFSGFAGFAGFSGFHFARLAVFAITGNPVKTNTNERLPVKDARLANSENPDYDKKHTPASPLWERARARARRAQARLCGRDARAPRGVKPASVNPRRKRLPRRLLDSRFRGNDGGKAAMTSEKQ